MALISRGLVMVALLGMLPSSTHAAEVLSLLGGDDDDECTAGTECALNALQRRASQQKGQKAKPDNMTDPSVSGKAADEDDDPLQLEPTLDEDTAALKAMHGGGWHIGGDKLWGGGTGMESVNGGNMKYYDRGMYKARGLCGDSHCALITNPAGHRTVNVFHIHFFHYNGHYASSLKHKLEKATCGKKGWHSVGPCGGRAKYVSGFPGVFSVARGAGGMNGASVIAWPSSCGGRGTIVELAYHCSVEHQIRGDYNPHHR